MLILLSMYYIVKEKYISIIFPDSSLTSLKRIEAQVSSKRLLYYNIAIIIRMYYVLTNIRMISSRNELYG